MSGPTRPNQTGMALKVEVKLHGMCNALIDNRSSRHVSRPVGLTTLGRFETREQKKMGKNQDS